MSKNNKNRKRTLQRKYYNNLPCRDCITLPICMNLYLKEEYQRDFLERLILKCELVDRYITGSGCRIVTKKNYFHRMFELTQLREKVLLNYYREITGIQ